MCLAVPLRLVDVRGELGQVAEAGVTRDVSLVLVPEAKSGDHVLVHAGFAIQILDEAEAQATLGLLRELGLGDGDGAR
jgi:hydrogenase expression/formation protein HypC